MEHLIIGTAGHVDHGKTVLISALTGVDTDRLQEEKKRGISIDLGFAPFRLPGGRVAGVVDVPGHERFIHNMLAGASGMDLVMLVVDATEGIMPQTREHLDILGLLGIDNGIVVITKIDLVEKEWIELVEEEIREELKGTFLESAPVQSVSAITGEGIESLKKLIDELTLSLKTRSSSGPLRLPVDRSFVIAGFGTVITGTLIQGSVRVGQIVSVIPPGLEARVRNIQVHDRDVNEAAAGSRVALNLSGIERDQVVRGSVVSNPGYYSQTSLLDTSLKLLPGATRQLKNLDPVHFFLGTNRCVARMLLLDRDRLNPGENALVQCRLSRPLVAERGDPFVIRSYSPMTTIGGGTVLDPYPNRHRRYRSEVLERLDELKKSPSEGGDAAFIRRKLEELVSAGSERLARETRFDENKVRTLLEGFIASGEVTLLDKTYMLSSAYREFKNIILSELKDYHRRYPLSPGLSRARLRGYLPRALGQREYDTLLERLVQEKALAEQNDPVRLVRFKPEPAGRDRETLDKLTTLYEEARLQPPSLKEALHEAEADQARKEEFMQYLQNERILVKVADDLYFHVGAYREALDILRRHFAKNETLTLALFRDLAKTSRKYAQALLEHFDRQKFTRRVGDHRVAARIEQSQERD